MTAAATLSPITSVAAAEPSACAPDLPLAPFLDVRRDGAHAAAIDCTYWYGLAHGRLPDMYVPDAGIRRDQLASLVARAIDASSVVLPASEEPAFDDLVGNVHRDAIERLAAAGIVDGRGPRRFDPHLQVPRGQLTTFLVRSYAYITGEPIPDAPDAFRDDDGHRHEASIDAAAALGLASGKGPDTFAPDQHARRDETATFLARLLERVAEAGALPPDPDPGQVTIQPLDAATRALLTGSSWRSGCPVTLDELRLLRFVHAGFDGRERWGLLVLHRDVVSEVGQALQHVREAGFPIRQARLIDRFGGDDDASMAADNTSAFNCRPVAGTTRWSEHAWGRAVDINPVENPWVDGDRVAPPAGSAFTDRGDVRPGMVVDGDEVTTAFDAIGWSWGGRWHSSRDYQHFSASGG